MAVATYIPVVEGWCDGTAHVRMLETTLHAGCRQEYVKLEDYQALERKNRNLDSQVEGLLHIINADEKPQVKELERKISLLEGQLRVAKAEKLAAEKRRREAVLGLAHILDHAREVLKDTER